MRSGIGGLKAATGRGAWVIPVAHRYELIDLSVKRIEIARKAEAGLICRDNIRADIEVAFFVRVNNSEEDILQVDLPSVRGRRRVTIRFGEPISVSNNGERRRSAAELTHTMQNAVQSILDDMNSESSDGQNTREEPVSA